MGTDYLALDDQSAADVPGATYANQLKDNQEALIEPASMRFMSADAMSWQGAFGSSYPNGTLVPSLTWTPLPLVSYKAMQEPSNRAMHMWQRDVASSTDGAEPWRSSTLDRSSGTFVDGALTLTRTDAFEAPVDGLYLVSFGVSLGIAVGATSIQGATTAARVSLLSGAGTDPILPNGAVPATAPIEVNRTSAFAWAVGTQLIPLSAGDAFQLEAYTTDNYSRRATAFLSAVRIGRGL